MISLKDLAFEEFSIIAVQVSLKKAQTFLSILATEIFESL